MRKHPFDGARLSEARRARQMKTSDLARIVNLTPSALSHYEKNRKIPSQENLQKLANALNVFPEFFYSDKISLPTGQGSDLFWRSLSSATKTARQSAEARYSWFRRIVTFLEEFVAFPTLNIPPLRGNRSPLELSFQDIEGIAVMCREHWGLGIRPIHNAVATLEKNGVFVCSTAVGNERIDAFSHFDPDDRRGYVILSMEKGSGPRSRYDVAHELGHLILHGGLLAGTAADSHTLIEAQAHRFAAAFLFPEEAFRREFFVPTLSAFIILKRKWRVSIAMMIKRAADLDLISSRQEELLWINYNKKRWRRSEPLDDAIEREIPTLIGKGAQVVFESALASRDDLKHAVPLKLEEIEALISLPTGTLENINPSVDNLIVFQRAKEEPF